MRSAPTLLLPIFHLAGEFVCKPTLRARCARDGPSDRLRPTWFFRKPRREIHDAGHSARISTAPVLHLLNCLTKNLLELDPRSCRAAPCLNAASRRSSVRSWLDTSRAPGTRCPFPCRRERAANPSHGNRRLVARLPCRGVSDSANGQASHRAGALCSKEQELALDCGIGEDDPPPSARSMTPALNNAVTSP